ncbi:hypothetical protein [Bartonella bacilliformis]|uniref:Uncharacterized protein n=2 Tax=Bartonella bacilliformis TaxID=774 RepID=A1URG3_BARBK|nr:hypothetical protein [Bartonella bacilliformis]ABM44792.1 conserved hypothetical protein [Bartonella bacilliformis KC583]AMG85431.1 hypothetical protein AL467_01210 [Bartonella bacilliformis]EKS45866.1 hypothetical protein BbINS_01096 [Bartonella bacilliformis INS]EYS89318.1 hypothetical protein X472_00746 [Bartonella bacilliformis San Pedro600-02]EYS93590.1 hypothetical protein X470_01202 [Bartonella bacilliformis Peru-18]
MAFFSIAEYRPDVADINGLFTDKLINVLPADGSYIPMPNFSPLSEPFPGSILGAIAVRTKNGVSVIVGSENKLYLLDNTTFQWKDISQKGKAYLANVDAPWSFALFGDYVIAVNANDKPQVIDIRYDYTFRNLGGNPPQAGIVRVWGDFVCLMKLSDHPRRVHWSGLNDAEFWTVGKKSCDYQDFPDGGYVQGATETTNPIIFMRSAIYAGSFIPGSKIIFSFQKIHDKRGAKNSESIVCRGDTAFFVDEGGFFQIANDGHITSIGFEKIDRTMTKKINKSYLPMMWAAIDGVYNRVYWMIDNDDHKKEHTLLIYDWGLQKWTIANVNVSIILPIFFSGYTLEGLDKISCSLDDLPFSLDSKAWKNEIPVLGAFNYEGRLGSFSGEPMACVVTSQEMGQTNGSMTRVNSIMPQVNSAQCYVTVGVRLHQALEEDVVWLPERQPSRNTGQIHCRARGRFYRFQLRIPAGAQWSHVTGFDVTSKPAGRR